MSAFDAALILLKTIVDCPGTQRLTIYADYKADNLGGFKAAIRVLEAAGRIDGNSWKMWLEWYGTKHSFVPQGMVEFISALPDEGGAK